MLIEEDGFDVIVFLVLVMFEILRALIKSKNIERLLIILEGSVSVCQGYSGWVVC